MNLINYIPSERLKERLIANGMEKQALSVRLDVDELADLFEDLDKRNRIHRKDLWAENEDRAAYHLICRDHHVKPGRDAEGKPLAAIDAVTSKRLTVMHESLREMVGSHFPRMVADLSAARAAEEAQESSIRAAIPKFQQRLEGISVELGSYAGAVARDGDLNRAHVDSIVSNVLVKLTKAAKWFAALGLSILLALLAIILLLAMPAKAHGQSQISTVRFDEAGVKKAQYAGPFRVNFASGCTLTATTGGGELPTVNVTCSGGSGSPGGSNTQVQFNDSSAFGGDADFTWNKTSNLLTITGTVYSQKIQVGTGVVTLPTDAATVSLVPTGQLSTDFAIGKTNALGADPADYIVYSGMNIGHEFAPSVNIPHGSAYAWDAILHVPATSNNLNFLTGGSINVYDEGTGTRSIVDGQENYVISAGNVGTMSGIYGSASSSGTVNKIAGVWGDADSTGTVSTWMYGVYGHAISNAVANPLNVGLFGESEVQTGTTTQNDGAYSKGVVSGGTVTTNSGVWASGNVSGGTVTNNNGLKVTNSLTGGTVTNNYGLNIGNITGGATLNYSIFTNGGLVHFGDSVDVAAGKTVTADTFIGALTGNASTATALAANPSDCASNQFANAIAASGNLTCAALTLAGAQFANQGTTTTVLHGNAAGNPSFGAVVEADITLADNTTNDVSTTKHGFAPKAPNDTTKFLRGDATWAVPTASATLVETLQRNYAGNNIAQGTNADIGPAGTVAPEMVVTLANAATLKNLFVTIGSTQAASQTLTTTVKVSSDGGASYSTCATLTVVIAGGSTRGTYSDTTHTCTVAQGNIVKINTAQQAGALSGANLMAIGVEVSQ